MQYRRAFIPGGTFFFTVNLSVRSSTLLCTEIDLLRTVMRGVMVRHPFKIEAMVVMPDHLHCIWSMPVEEIDYPKRWSLIKAGFSRNIPKSERISLARQRKGERGIWQRRYWEHRISDERDLETHINYIHLNPVKHGYVNRPVEWPYSSIHRYIKNGLVPRNWATDLPDSNGGFGEAENM